MSGKGGKSNGGRGNGTAAQTPSPQQEAEDLAIPEESTYQPSRGLDSGLAKAAPKAEGLTQKTYRSYRRRLELFAMQCKRRGRDAEVEGAYLVVSLWRDVVWEAAEQLDLEEVEVSDNPFSPLFELLDQIFQREDLIEVPSRCEEFFAEFFREKGEEMQAYLMRHRTLMKKLKEVKVEVPKLLGGWHLLSRSGIPKWMFVQIKTMCNGELEYEKVAKALLRVFGGDHKPNSRDLARGAKEENFYEDEMDESEEAWFEEEYTSDWNYESYDHEEVEDETYYEEEIPEDVEEAWDEAEDAFVNYMESRRRMRELALSRGFYPIVAIGPEASSKGSGKSKGSKGKGKGKSKGGKSKGKGKGFQVRRTFNNRRPMSGLRRDTAFSSSSTTTTPSSTEMRSTLTGSAASHGPRFKRYRLANSGVKEVPEEQVSMVEDMSAMPVDECFFNTSAPGEAIVDSGATRTIVGEDVWRRWIREFPEELSGVKVEKVARDFRFGGGEVLRSHYDVIFPVEISGINLEVQASVVPGKTPFLVARPTLEKWEAKQDYATGHMKLKNGEWFQPLRGEKGHYMLPLLRRKENIFSIISDMPVSPDEDRDVWSIESCLEPNGGGDEKIEIDTEEEEINKVLDATLKRELLFFEVYVDRGNLSQFMLTNFPDVNVGVFGLPEWDFRKKKDRAEFLKIMRQERPHFVFLAPPCRVWSPMQMMNIKTEKQKEELLRQRDEDESSHLELAKDAFIVGEHDGIPVGMEHPDRARSWNTKTMQLVGSHHDAVCDRCRTGLTAKDEVNGGFGKVRKPTRIRTKSKIVADAMNLPCKCTEPHVQMMGRSKELKDMQNYEPAFVKILASAIYEEMEEQWRKREVSAIMVAEEMNEDERQDEEQKNKRKSLTEEEKKSAKEHGGDAMRVVSKLHRQLGHPNNDRLVAALRDAKMHEKVIECAKTFSCAACKNQSQKKLPKPTSLPQASFFNELIEMDTFHIKWRGDRKKVFAVIDVFSKFEVNAAIKSEALKDEAKVLEEKWFSWAGFPQQIRTDSSGAHMSEEFQSWCDDKGIKLTLVPKEAHHRMGTVERLHAVRRQQLHKMMTEDPKITLEEAVIHSTAQRNNLRNINGCSPAQLVFGKTPSMRGLADEPHGVLPTPGAVAQEQQHLRYLAAKAFYEANHDSTIRKALLAKTRAEHEVLEVGTYAYYWRFANDKLETSRWRGPALICAIEPRTDTAQRVSAYWLVHGCSLVRAAPEQVRPEVSTERLHRLDTMPDTALRDPLHQQLRRALQPTRGPIRFLDLGPHTSLSDASASGAPPEELQQRDQQRDEKRQKKAMDEEMIDGQEWPEVRHDEEKEVRHDEEKDEKKEESARESGESATPGDSGESTTVRESGERATEEKTETQRSADQREEGESAKEADQSEKPRRERSRSPMERDETYKRMVRESRARARRLDGLPPEQEDEFLAEEFNEKMLTPEQKKEFDLAKDEALQVWITNKAWKAVPKEAAQEGEVVPARFIQRWKPKPEHPNGRVANARVILQGFRHNDVLNKELDRESPTLSRAGRMSIFNFLVHRQWKLFSADVKSAFMQADSIDAETRIFIRPTSDMRRRLERMMGLKPDEILKATKPPFGDVRAPRQWYGSADRTMMEELFFLRHPLDHCVYLSYRAATNEDDERSCFQLDGQKVTVDGVLGLHVDDYVGGGERIHQEQDLEGEYDGQFLCFRDRLCGLSKRFRFGSWSFGPTVHFCGMELVQSLDYASITLSLRTYLTKVKPITMEKARKAMSQDLCDEKEVRQLRALVGALAWPANQCVPQLAASVSLLQGSLASARVQDIAEANKVLRFAKEAVQKYEMRLSKHGEFEDIRFSAYCDAAWATRPDGSSQGGYLIFVANDDEMKMGKPMPLSIVDWASRKLQRMCRSSLAAEAQAAAIAVDELEWMKVFNAALRCPVIEIQEEETLRMTGPSALITDAKSLYDASRSMSSGLKLSEKRTAIEVCIVNQRMDAMQGNWLWVNSHQQLADGLTKGAAKDKFNEVLQRGVHQLKYDEKCTASKKVSKEDRDRENESLKNAAQRMKEEVNFLSEEEKLLKGICLEEGCGKEVDKSANPKNRFCSRRHFYKHQNRTKGMEDAWSNAALRAAAILMCENLPKSEASRFEVVLKFDVFEIFITFVFILIPAVLYFCAPWIFNKQQQQQETDTSIEAHVNPVSHVVEAHVQTAEASALSMPDVFADQVESRMTSPSSEPQSEPLLDGSEDPNDILLPYDEFSLQSFLRWKNLRDSVLEEDDQQGWKRKMENIICGREDISEENREALVKSHTTVERMRRFQAMFEMDVDDANDHLVECWHRFSNRNNLELFVMVDLLSKEQRKTQRYRDMLHLAPSAASAADMMRFKVSVDEVREHEVQTALTFANSDPSSSYQSEWQSQSKHVRQLPRDQYGAWLSRSLFNERW